MEPALFLTGSFYRGVDHSHSEIGHHLIDPSVRLGGAVFEDARESLVAGPAMVAWMDKKDAPPDYRHRALALTAKENLRTCAAE